MANMQLLTVPQVAEILAVSEDRVRTMVRQGRVASINIGSAARPIYRIRESALEEYLKAFESRPATADVIKPSRQRRVA